MAHGEGAEQLPTSFLPPVKHTGQENGISVSKKKKKTQGVSVCSKVCFAIGGAPYQITGSALGFFLQIYLLDVAQLDAFHASIILFVGRACDAVTDPTVGFLVSRTTWTRHGRLMPWIVLSTPFAVLSYFLIWVVPPLENGKAVWYLFFYCIFQSLQTCFHVPYSALTMFISSEQKERDSATAYRMTVEVFGTVLGTAIQGQIVGGANAPCLNPKYLNDSCAAQLIADVNISRLSLDDTKHAYMWASGLICFIYVLCAVILFLGVREQRDVRCVKSVKSLSFVEGLKLLRNHGPYFRLVMAFLFTSLAFMLMEGNFALFLTYTMGLRNDFQNILLTIMLSATLTIPLWQHLLSRYGKKTITYIGTLWAVPFMILVVCIESSLVVSYIVSVAAGASVGVAFFLPWSMLPDAVDDYKVQHPNSHGHEAIFYSFYVFFTKFASGISLGLSTLSLHFAGYVTRACVQPDSVNLTLKLLVSAAPVTLIILGLLILKSYPINEERRKENRNRLLAMMQDCREQHLEISV